MSNIRNIIKVHAADEPLIDEGESNIELDPMIMVKATTLILAIISVVAFLGSIVTMMYPEALSASMKVMMRQIERMKRKAKKMPQWGEAKSSARRIFVSLVKKEEVLQEALPDNITKFRGASIDDHDLSSIIIAKFPFSGGGDRGMVKKTKIRIAMRIIKVMVGLLNVALSLFKLFAQWEDDPGMTALFVDTKDIIKTAAASGARGGAQKLINSQMYRMLRTLPGIGSIIPRRGRSLVAPRALTT